MIGDKRVKARFALRIACPIRMTGGVRRQSRMIDISEYGARIETLFRINHDELIWIDLGDFRNLACRAIWSSASFTGLRFCSPLHPSILDAFMAKRASYYFLDCTDLDEIGDRSQRELLRATTEIDIDQLRLLSADCRRASMVNRVVQSMRNNDQLSDIVPS